MINFSPFINMLLRKKDKSEPRIFSKSDKNEIDKINKMGLFESIDYLTDDENIITYCGACGGDASNCDGC